MSFAPLCGKPSVVALSEIAPPPDFGDFPFCPSSALALLSCGRGLSMSTSVAWSAATLLLGIAGPITIAAIYPRLVATVSTLWEMRRVIDKNARRSPSEGIEYVLCRSA